MCLSIFLRYQKTAIVMSIFVFLSFAVPVNAEDILEESGIGQSDNPEAPVANFKKSEEGKLSIEFSDVGLNEVLKILSSLSGSNFVASEDAAKKKVSLFLENVSFEDALEAIVKGNGLIIQKVGESNIFLIRGSTGEDALSPLETRVFKLKYVRAAKVKVSSLSESTSTSSGGSSSGASSGSSSGAGVGSSSVGTSAAISGGEPSEIKDTIEDLLSPRGKVTVDDRTNSLVITDSSDRLEQIEKVIVILDHPLDQVLIEVIILETAMDLDRFIGTEWGTGSGEANSLGTISGARGVFSVPSVNQLTDITHKSGFLEDGTGLSFGSYDFSQLTATLRALQVDTRTKVLAKPKILTLDNEPAFIKITVNEVIGVNSQVSAGGGIGENLETSTAERSETGITLKVTPLINDENYITLLLEPRYATADVSTFDPDFKDPRIRASRTTLAVESGKAISISGLLQREEVKIKRKVPFFGDIPIFGVFFTKWTTNKLDRELMIFLRPVIVRRENSGIVQARSIPDQMTSIDEDAADFWKFWEKPWFKDKYIGNTKNSSEEVEDFFNERSKVMEQALQLENQKVAALAAQKAEKAKLDESKKSKLAAKSEKQKKADEPKKETVQSKANSKTKQPEKPKEAARAASQMTIPVKPEKRKEEKPVILPTPASQEVPPQSSAASPLRVKPA